MRKKILIVLLVFGIVIAAPAFAVTTVSFSSQSINVNEGQNFNVIVSVNPQNVSNYTEKIELNYPADLIEARSFSFGNSWTPLSQQGYDLIDNTNGVLIKTAGYPGGISSSAIFGTVSFFAKKAGTGAIKLGSNSLAFDVNSQNVLSGMPEISVKIAALAASPVPLEPTVSQPEVVSPKNKEATSTITKEAEKQQVVENLLPISKKSLLAQIGDILTLNTGRTMVGIIVGLMIIALLSYAIYLFIRKKSHNDSKKI